VAVRFTEAERELIESAAEGDEQSVSAWVRDQALTAARRRQAHRSQRR